MEKLAKRIRSSNQQYFDAGVDAKVCGGYFQPFFERNDLIKDWWDR